jgi:hypothetical protein
MEVAVHPDNDRKIRMLKNPMKFDFHLGHNTLAARQSDTIFLNR